MRLLRVTMQTWPPVLVGIDLPDLSRSGAYLALVRYMANVIAEFLRSAQEINRIELSGTAILAP